MKHPKATRPLAFILASLMLLSLLAACGNKVTKTDPETPSALAATYGDTLGDITLPTGWSFDAAATTPVGNAGENKFAASFAGTDTLNEKSAVDLTVMVAKATPAYTLPTGLTATYGDTLADVTLSGGFVWATPETSVGNAGDRTFKANYTPTDTANYNIVKGLDVTVAVSKATPNFTAPSGLTATYGDTLAAVTLGEGFAWAVADTTSVGNAGVNEFKVNYTPADAANYNVASDIAVNVTVSKATPSFTTPMALSAVYGQTLAAVSLPIGFTWAVADTTSVGNAGVNEFKVNYIPADTANYNVASDIVVNVTVAKATPNFTAPSAVLDAAVGQTLADIAGQLPSAENGVFGWETAATSVGAIGSRTFNAKFTPTDTGNYETVGNIAVSVKVTQPVVPKLNTGVFAAAFPTGKIPVLTVIGYQVLNGVFNDTAYPAATYRYDLQAEVESVWTTVASFTAAGENVLKAPVGTYRLIATPTGDYSGAAVTLNDFVVDAPAVLEIAKWVDSASTAQVVGKTRNGGTNAVPDLTVEAATVGGKAGSFLKFQNKADSTRGGITFNPDAVSKADLEAAYALGYRVLSLPYFTTTTALNGGSSLNGTDGLERIHYFQMPGKWDVVKIELEYLIAKYDAYKDVAAAAMLMVQDEAKTQAVIYFDTFTLVKPGIGDFEQPGGYISGYKGFNNRSDMPVYELVNYADLGITSLAAATGTAGFGGNSLIKFSGFANNGNNYLTFDIGGKPGANGANSAWKLNPGETVDFWIYIDRMSAAGASKDSTGTMLYNINAGIQYDNITQQSGANDGWNGCVNTKTYADGSPFAGGGLFPCAATDQWMHISITPKTGVQIMFNRLSINISGAASNLNLTQAQMANLVVYFDNFSITLP